MRTDSTAIRRCTTLVSPGGSQACSWPLSPRTGPSVTSTIRTTSAESRTACGGVGDCRAKSSGRRGFSPALSTVSTQQADPSLAMTSTTALVEQIETVA